MSEMFPISGQNEKKKTVCFYTVKRYKIIIESWLADNYYWFNEPVLKKIRCNTGTFCNCVCAYILILFSCKQTGERDHSALIKDVTQQRKSNSTFKGRGEKFYCIWQAFEEQGNNNPLPCITALLGHSYISCSL